MIGKLIKLECKSSMKLISLIWLALVVAGVLMGIWVNLIENMSANNPLFLIVEILPPMIYGVLFIAMIVVSVMMVLLRFYRGVLGDEGYLTHTLPVKTWQIITSKGIVSGIIVTVSIIVGAISLILMGICVDFSAFKDLLGEMRRFIGDEPRYLIVGVEVLIVLIAGILKSIYQVYAAMAIGQLVDKYRILLTVGAYIGISAVLTVIGSFVSLLAEMDGFISWVDSLFALNYADGVFTMMQFIMLGVFLLTVIQLVAFHIVTERILSLKLNLL